MGARLSITFVPLAVALGLAAAAVILAQVSPALADSLAHALNPVPESVARPGPVAVLGLYPERLIAGFIGGLASLASSNRPRPLALWLKRALLGAAVGNYVPLAPELAGAVVGVELHEPAPLVALALAFVFGLMGDLLITKLRREGAAA